ncbi:hypothetical protein [Salmonella enterica]|uniref:hypothetical protein n=1 Tax=Salmonella enterica TaxID=28901 RepID=UPI00193CAD96|nr:hypothetical protein [Salmonella enterica]EEN5589350.1 hypothetical protein [Salmonella enterica subsp. enterica serovar Mountpleasant]
MTGNLYLKNDARMHFAIMNEDGNVRMWLYKDKGGDGIRINNGIDGGGDFVLGKNGEFYSPSHIHAGSAVLNGNGDTYGSVWGNQYISTWLNNCFAARDNNINIRATWDWVNQNFVNNITLGEEVYYSPGSNTVSWIFHAPAGHVFTGINVQDTGAHSADNIGGVYYKPIQKKVNGVTMTIAG